MSKKNIIIIISISIITLIGTWYFYQASTAKLVVGGGGVWDQKTRKFLAPQEIEKLKKESEQSNDLEKEDKINSYYQDIK